VRAQQPGQGAFGVVGAEADGVGEELAFGVELPGTWSDLAERQVAGRAGGGGLLDGSRQLGLTGGQSALAAVTAACALALAGFGTGRFRSAG